MIPIKGVIGYDVIGTEFAEMLSRLRGDIDFEIDSPGGSVFDGISIFNAIKNYDKGKCNIRVVGDCSSMAAYIMLAGDTLKFESNAIVVLHNPWQIAIGDYHAMQESAIILEKLAAMYAEKFVEKGIFKSEEIRQIMDAETWFVGASDLKRLGEVIESGSANANNGDKEIKIAALREKMQACKAKIKALNKTDIDKIAALMPLASEDLRRPPSQTTAEMNLPAPASATPASKQKQDVTVQKIGDIIMNLQELKTQNAALYNEVIALGVQQERARVAAFMGFIDVDKDATIKALKEGKEISDNEFQAAILMARVKQDTIKGMEKDNNENVDPQTEIHAPENQQADEKQKEEQAKAAREKEEKQLAKIVELAVNA